LFTHYNQTSKVSLRKEEFALMLRAIYGQFYRPDDEQPNTEDSESLIAGVADTVYRKYRNNVMPAEDFVAAIRSEPWVINVFEPPKKPKRMELL
jgi:hypothetical protein